MKSLNKVWIEKTGIKSPNTGMETLIIHNAIKIEKSLDKKKTTTLDWKIRGFGLYLLTLKEGTAPNSSAGRILRDILRHYNEQFELLKVKQSK